MQAEDRVRILHMRDACLAIERFVRGRERADLDRDEMLRFALVRALEIIGEAAARVTEDLRLGQPGIPWREAVGTRNRLIHAYFDVDLDVLWRTVVDDIPALLPAIDQLLSGQPDLPTG